MTVTEFNRPTWAEINLDNLAFNFHSVRRFVGEEYKYMAVVKANAYGHGAVECATRLEFERIDWFGVALPEEGIELRRAGISKPILCLGGFWSGQEEYLLDYDLTPVIYQIEKARAYNTIAARRNITANVHIKIDTGMGRIGVRFDEFQNFAENLKQFRNLRVQGVMTHFAAADKLSENEFTNEQIRRFYQALDILKKAGFNPDYYDLANSPGAIAHATARGNMVRLGGVLYGLGGDVLPKEIEKPELKPVMTLHSRISHLKKVPKGESLGYSRTFVTERNSIIATIPIGYHDGYTRRLSNCGRAVVNGAIVPVVGRISMDWTILDVTDVSDVKIDDEVVLIGEQKREKIYAEDLAEKTGTISYEITCGIDRRVRRIYVGGK
ncbi:MAG TPA: alanine racemase [Pyrinomonadaceae bacterium]|jgi:alanine racemase